MASTSSLLSALRASCTSVEVVASMIGLLVNSAKNSRVRSIAVIVSLITTLTAFSSLKPSLME